MADPTQAAEARVTARTLTLPNVLSGVRIALVPIFLWLFLSGRENVAAVVFVAGAATDFFDGYIARHTGTISELGQVLDPLADRIFILALALALVARGVLAWWVAAAVVVRDLIVVSAFPVLARKGIRRIEVNVVGKWGTGLLLFGLAWLGLSETTFWIGRYGEDIGTVSVAVGVVLYWVAAGMYARAAAAELGRAGERG